MTSFGAASETEVVAPRKVPQGLLLKALKPILSVPKKFFSVCVNAAVAEAWPEG